MWEIPFSNFPINAFIGYYVLGYYVKKYRNKIKEIPLFYIILTYVGGFGISYFSTKYVLESTGKRVSLFFDKNSLGTFFMTMGFFALWIRKDFKNRNKVIKILSESTYFAYLVHLLVLKYVRMISDEMIFKSVATIIISVILGIIYNFSEEKIKGLIKYILK